MMRAFRLALLMLLPAVAIPIPAMAEEVPATGSDFGGAGLIEMRNARFREDGVLEAGGSYRHQRRFWFLNFQALPFLETTFRLSERLNATTGQGSTTDRSFDVKLRLLEEGPWNPALAIGLQDLIGTGIYGGEYVVASRRWGPLDVSLGLGFGRLGTRGDFANPLTDLSDGFRTRPRDVGRGGTLRLDFFRGENVAVFGGAEYSLPRLETPWGEVEGLRAKIEWSGDALRDERGGYPVRRGPLRGAARSPVNFGLQWSAEFVDAGLQFVHGTDLLARLSLRMDPATPPSAPPLRPLPPMPARRAAGEEPRSVAAFEALREAGFRPIAYEERGVEARIAVSEGRFRSLPQVASRVLRAVNAILPPEVEVIRLSWWQAGAEMGAMMVPRRAIEAAAGDRTAPGGSAEEAWSATTLFPAEGTAWPDAFAEPGPHWDWVVEPRLSLQLGDPSRTLRYQGAVAAGARVEFGAGFSAAGAVQQAVFGNLDRGLPSDSQLPRVRSDYALYARDGKTSIPGLYAERVWNLAPDVFARATAGLLEPMFGGISSEVLWRPVDRGFALGLDLNVVQQRATDGLFGFRDYGVATGHVSLYADLPVWNLYGILRAGRYLAGDWGGTIEMGRRFDSGIEVGAFATFTDVPFSRFGEGSFDKGIYVRVPLSLFGQDSRGYGTAVIRPVQRDGGQRLAVDNALWEVTRAGREDAARRGIGGYAR